MAKYPPLEKNDDRPIEPQFYAIGVDGVHFIPGGADPLKAVLDRIFG